MTHDYGVRRKINTLCRLASRHACRNPFQSLFFIVGVSIGVGMIIAIDLANSSVHRAFDIGTDFVVGSATHQIVGGPLGVDEAVYVRIRRELGYRQIVPVVEGYVKAESVNGRVMHLLGIDVFAGESFRNGVGPTQIGISDEEDLILFMAHPNTVVIGKQFGDEHQLMVDDTLVVRVGSHQHRLRIVGVISSENKRLASSLENVLLADIATAQEMFGKEGTLDRIDVVLPGTRLGPELLHRVQSMLPAGTRIETSEARRGAVVQMTKSFRLNLTALSLLALLVGMFLIYNTVSFSVLQQLSVIGRLRAVGTTRAEIFGIILAEACLLGLAGALLGLVMGPILGRGAVAMVTNSINDLFFVNSVREVDVPFLTLFKGILFGLSAAIVGALLPAYQATQISPIRNLQRSDIEARTVQAICWTRIGGVSALLIGIGLLLPQWHLIITFIGVLMVLIGMALFTPSIMHALIKIATHNPMRCRVPVLGVMALRNIHRSLSRTSVTVAALMIAVSVIIGVSVMMGSFRGTVERWLTDLLQADIFVTPPTLSSGHITERLDPWALKQLRTIPAIAEIATARSVEVHASGIGSLILAAVSRDIAGKKRQYKSAIGSRRETWNALQAGGLIVNEPLATRYKIDVNDTVTLFTDLGEMPFKVVGVAYDFDVRSCAIIHDEVYREFWSDPHFSSAALYLQPGVDISKKIEEIQAAFKGKLELVIRSNRVLRESALAVFDRTFSITAALQILAIIVAFIGVLSALMSLQLERAREVGTLRALGLTGRQLSKLTMLETVLMGAFAGVIAIPTGLILGAILIYVINVRSFGWTVQMQPAPLHLILGLGVSLAAATLAGIYPSWRMSKMKLVQLLRTE